LVGAAGEAMVTVAAQATPLSEKAVLPSAVEMAALLPVARVLPWASAAATWTLPVDEMTGTRLASRNSQVLAAAAVNVVVLVTEKGPPVAVMMSAPSSVDVMFSVTWPALLVVAWVTLSPSWLRLEEKFRMAPRIPTPVGPSTV
jgi:hypothetical protein